MQQVTPLQLLWITAIAVFLLPGCGRSVDGQGETAPRSASSDSADRSTELAERPPIRASDFTPDDLGQSTLALVTHVPDGDSFEVVIEGSEERVRMLGINTPEGDECFGDEAGDRLREAIFDKEITLVTISAIDANGSRDEFGRILAFVFVGDELVNQSLIAQGAAIARDQSDHPAASAFEETEDAARNARLGLWAADACGPAASDELRISDINANAPGPDDENPNGEWIDITNDGSDAVNLSGWSVRDESTRHRYAFSDGFTLAGGAAVKLRTGCGDDSATELFWCERESTVWNNGGDTAFLLDPNGNIIDSLSYSE